MAPSIYGHEDVKRALALALFGGEPKDPGEYRVVVLLLIGCQWTLSIHVHVKHDTHYAKFYPNLFILLLVHQSPILASPFVLLSTRTSWFSRVPEVF